MTRVLIAEDSVVVAEILKRLFETDPRFSVVGVAGDGESVVRMAADLKPDVITMDVIMPKMDGVAATERIMAETPTPIVIISSHVNDKEMRVTFRSLAAGALSVLEKPENVFSPAFEGRRRQFLDTIQALSELKVTRRTSRPAMMPPDAPSLAAKLPQAGSFDVFVVGASTGGPQAISQILKSLPATFPMPVIIAQHITRGFTQGMVDWLGASCALSLKVAEDGEPARAGVVYFAPDGTDVSVVSRGGVCHLAVSPVKPEGVLTPNVDVLFHSARVFGARVICGVLTGMGGDGADGMLMIKNAGGWTFAEAEETCVVYGMPQVAFKKGATRHVLPLHAIAQHLLALVGLAKRSV